MKSIKFKKIKYLLFVIFFSLFLNSYTYASKLLIRTSETATVGQRISVDILIDPEKNSINSIQSSINFSPEFFEFSGFSAKQSTIPIWVEEPKEKFKGQISFSGVIPGGLDKLYDPLNSSNNIPVVKLFFTPKKIGNSKIFIDKSIVLKNDGKGTSVDVTTDSIEIKIISQINLNTEVNSIKDNKIPEPFNITLIERSLFGRTPRLAVFQAEDIDGGINRYEVSIGNMPFFTSSSPVALPYRLFSYPLTIRAFDYSGNMREQQIIVPTENSYIILLPILLGLLIIIGFFRYRFYNRVRI